MTVTEVRVDHRVGLDGVDRGACVIRIDQAGNIVSVTKELGFAPSEELEELTAIPLLADAHAHLGISDGVTDDVDFHTGEHVDGQLRGAVAFGIGHLHSLGTDQRWLTRRLNGRLKRGDPDGMAYGYSAGVGFGAIDGWPPELSSPERRFRPRETKEAHRQVRELAHLGCKTLKIWVDDFGGALPKTPLPIVQAIIQEAREQGITTFSHVKSHDDAESLVATGVDVLAHSVRDCVMNSQLLDAMAERGTVLVPTLSREDAEYAFSLPENPYLTNPFFQKVAGTDRLEKLSKNKFLDDAASPRRRLDIAVENAGLAHANDIDVGLGTDGGFKMKLLGYSEHREIELLQQAGLSVQHSLRAGLEVNKRLFATAMTDIVPGIPASFFVVRGGPYDANFSAHHIEKVWIAGRAVNGDTAGSFGAN